MPIFSSRTTPLPSLRAYTLFSIFVLSLAMLLRHHPEEDPPTHQLDNKTENETQNANGDESIGFSKWVVVNIAFCTLLWLSKIAVRGVFGELRVGEQQQVRERLWNFAFYKFVFLFGVISIQDLDELMSWLIWLSLLAFFTMWGHLVKMRSEYICLSPHTHWSIHATLLSTSMAVLSSTVLLFALSYYLGYDYGVDHFIFMITECIILALRTMHTMMKHGIHLYDESRPGIWENRATYSYYVDFACDVMVLFIDFLHHIHMMLWANIFLSVASLVIFTQLRSIYSELKKRYERHRNFMRVSQELETRFPPASRKELDECSDNCAICWDVMESARKLPCEHLFHLSCLRSWLEQDTTCPTCRVSLGDSQRPTEPNNLAQDIPPAPQQPQQIQGIRNSVWEFDGTQYASWLPFFSVEVVRGQQRSSSLIDDMVQRVHAVLPQVPYSAVVADLQQTGSIQQTINNFIDYTPAQAPVSNDQDQTTVRHRHPWMTSGHSDSGRSHLQMEGAMTVASPGVDVVSDENLQRELTDQNDSRHHLDEDANVNNSHSQARVTAQLRLPKFDEGKAEEDVDEVAHVIVPTANSDESRDACGSARSRTDIDDSQQRRLLALQAAERRLQQQQQ